MRFRLLQARRANDPVRAEEHAQFAARLEVDIDQVVPWNAMEETNRIGPILQGVDAVLVGGSGEFSIYDDEPWLPSFIDALGEVAARKFPTFASCFGFQGMVEALGGEVRHDEAATEVGTFEISLTAEAIDDDLFRGMPSHFLAQLGHKDRAMHMPDNVTLLARSERCPYQAFKVDDSLIYATQFHPELTGDNNKGRFLRYRDIYMKSLGQTGFHEVLEGFGPSPECSSLLRRFRDLVAE